MPPLRYLDLRCDTIESVAGKHMNICGVDYLLHELIGEGGQSFTFPLENLSSHICWFVAKVCKWKPGSLDYEAERHTFTEGWFELNANGIGTHRSEVHEVHGGLIRFEPNYQPDKNVGQYHKQLMDQGRTLLKEGRHEDAIKVYEQVLRLNDKHSQAMINMAGCFIGLNRPEIALTILKRSHEIEPNDHCVYHQAAFALTAMNSPRDAIHALDASLVRYKWDFETWQLRTRIAIDNNLADELIETERHLNAMFDNKQEKIASFLSRLSTSKESASQIHQVMAKARDSQHDGDWAEALKLWNVHRSFADGDPIARLNIAICEYHLGKAGNVAERVPLLLSDLPEMQANCCALLCLLCSIQVGKWNLAKQIANVMNEQISSPWDLPGIPIVASEYMLESEDVCPVILALELLQRSGHCSISEEANVGLLRDKYVERSK